MNETRQSWDRHYLDLARLIASRSRDRSTKVGAVIVDAKHSIVATGYNGFPRGIDDDRAERHERPAKYLWTCHAEENAIVSAARLGHATDGCAIYVTHAPCARCARSIIQAGIVQVVCPAGTVLATMREDVETGIRMLDEAGVTFKDLL